MYDGISNKELIISIHALTRSATLAGYSGSVA